MSPFDGSAAYSQYTPIKQHELATFLKVAAPIYRETSKKWPKLIDKLTIMDITAGPGVVNDQPGSPLLLINALASAQPPVVGARLIVVERDLATVSRLYENLNGHPAVAAIDLELQVEHADNGTVLSQQPYSGCVGLVYWDGNGKDRIPLDDLAGFSRRRPRAELLLNPAINADKRRGDDPLQRIDLVRAMKDHWVMRHVRQRNDWQFVFLLGSNWKDRKGENAWAKKLRSHGWLNADIGEAGDELIRQLCGHGPEQVAFDV
jgi:hypothetical protein